MGCCAKGAGNGGLKPTVPRDRPRPTVARGWIPARDVAGSLPTSPVGSGPAVTLPLGTQMKVTARLRPRPGSRGDRACCSPTAARGFCSGGGSTIVSIPSAGLPRGHACCPWARGLEPGPPARHREGPLSAARPPGDRAERRKRRPPVWVCHRRHKDSPLKGAGPSVPPWDQQESWSMMPSEGSPSHAPAEHPRPRGAPRGAWRAGP